MKSNARASKQPCNERIKQSFPSLSVIMCCSPIREAVRAATHYYTKALQTLIQGKDSHTKKRYILGTFLGYIIGTK